MMRRYQPGDDYEPGEESIFEHLRDHPPTWLRGGAREEGWREGLEASLEHILGALGDSFNACPYPETVAGLTPQSIWEMAILNAASRLGLQIFPDDEEEEEKDDEDEEEDQGNAGGP